MIKFQALSAEVQREATPDWTVPPMEQGLAVAVRVLAVVEQGLAVAVRVLAVVAQALGVVVRVSVVAAQVLGLVEQASGLVSVVRELASGSVVRELGLVEQV